MKKLILSCLLIVSSAVYAQDCSNLFISAYVEGYGNNRAVEIYNPTDQTVNMSDYSVGRFSNGSTEFVGIQLQDFDLAPYGTYLVVLDKRDPEGSGYEEPVWNGYVLLGEVLDEVTGLPLLDDNDEPIIGVQYDAEGGTLYGDVYNADYDLQGLADEFVCPVYSVNNALYHNGNDAVALIEGTEVDPVSGSNILDVVGVIGEDPGESWVDEDGGWITRDHTLKRKSTVKSGTGPVFGGAAFEYENWEIYPKNTFNVLGAHTSDCDVTSSIDSVNEAVITLSPNPAVNSTLITSDVPMQKITVMNIAGQLVNEVILDFANSYRLDLSENNAGIYVVTTTLQNGTTSTQKLFVK